MSGRVLWLATVLVGALVSLWGLLALPRAASQVNDTAAVIISEVAWSGTAAGSTFEWLELYNRSDGPIDLSGWSIMGDELLANLSGVILPNQYYILEHNESALIDMDADHFLTSVLDDDGEPIRLLDQDAAVVDSANIAGESWPAGTADDDHLSMERVHPLANDEPAGWVSNDGLTRNGFDADGQPVNGTPGMPNSTWNILEEVDLALQKIGPGSIRSGGTLTYTITISNAGLALAESVFVTDTLPSTVDFTDHDGKFPLMNPDSDTLIWSVGNIEPDVSVSIRLTATVDGSFTGLITNTAEVGSSSAESHVYNNVDSSTTAVSLPGPRILIDAVYYDGYEYQDRDEAVRLINVGGSVQNLTGWRLSDGAHEAIFPAGAVLPPAQAIWVADWAENFRSQFGHDPDYEVRGTDPNVPNLEGTWPGFSNTGDEVLLRSIDGAVQDVLVYKTGDTSQQGWSGPALEPYVVSGVFAAEGQILYRLFGADRNARVPDTDSSNDWAQSTDSAVDGRRVRYPGWDVERFHLNEWFTETAELVVGIAPDNAFEMLQNELAAAESTLRIASHTFRSHSLKQELVAALDRGVSVTVLLEGHPVGGIEVAERTNCQELELAGGQCWFMINDPNRGIHDRYRYLHAKYILIDDRRVVVSTENLSPDSFPDDDKSDGTWGRRGVVLATDAPSIVNRAGMIWDSDFDPENHQDLARWPALEGHLDYTFTSATELEVTNGTSYTVRYAEPSRFVGEFAFGLVQAPENALNSMGLLHLLNQAGAGDTVLAEQLTERPYWGTSNSNPLQDPNPRLEAMIDAARRGARVRMILDEYFDDGDSPIGNIATCDYANKTALLEQLDLQCEQANPTGLGLHNKMILVDIDDRQYIFIGSINGTELSNKGNRELALMVRSPDAYALLEDLFMHDWPYAVSLPVVFRDYVGPAQHTLISEVLYDPPGNDDAEYIELFNPTLLPMDLSGYSIGDALHKSDFEDVRLFPYGTILNPGATLVIASSATGFYAEFGLLPDYEILDSDPSVANLADNTNWGDPAAILQLANGGDEVILRDTADQIIDAIAYGSGQLPGHVSCALNIIAGAVLERYPPWRDTDDCPADFREWPFPNPGLVP